MENLFKFELRKLFKSAYFYIGLGIILFLCLFTNVIDFLDYSQNGYFYSYTSGQKLETFTYNPLFLETYSECSINTILPLFVIIYFLGDYAEGTIKNIYSKGFTRTQYFVCRFLCSLIFLGVYFVGFYLFNYFISSSFFGAWKVEDPSMSFLMVILQFLLSFTYVSMAIFACGLNRKMWLPILFVIFVPTVMSLVLEMIVLAVNSENFDIFRYWFGTYSTSSILSLFIEDSFSIISIKNTTENLIYAICNFVIYSAAFCIGGFFLFKKDEI